MVVNKAEVNSINYSCALFITQCHESHLSIKVSTSVMIMPISLCTRHTVRRNFTYESESFYLELFLGAFFMISVELTTTLFLSLCFTIEWLSQSLAIILSLLVIDFLLMMALLSFDTFLARI